MDSVDSLKKVDLMFLGDKQVKTGLENKNALYVGIATVSRHTVMSFN